MNYYFIQQKMKNKNNTDVIGTKHLNDILYETIGYEAISKNMDRYLWNIHDKFIPEFCSSLHIRQGNVELQPIHRI